MRYYKYVFLICMLFMLGGCAETKGATLEPPVKNWSSDIRETPGAQFMIPSLSPKPTSTKEWKIGYAKTTVKVFAKPEMSPKTKAGPGVVSDGEPIGSLNPKEAVNVLEIKKDASGQVAWLKVDKVFVKGTESWVEANKMVNNLSGLIARPVEGVEYGPIQKVKEYPNNPKVKVKGIYLTANSAGGRHLENLIRFADQTEINAFVIDVKDDSGRMLFKTKAASLFCPEANQGSTVKDIKALVKKLKEKNIYLIARIVAFKTPNYALRYPARAITDINTGAIYQSSDKLLWASAYDRQLWRYNVEVAKEAAEAGFNEIQFDYVRFPDIRPSVEATLDYKNEFNESKTLAIHRFLRFARAELEPYGVYMAADTFGWTANSIGDENIGQHWESITNVLDYNCPMMYPSHYGRGNFGFAVPDAHPYETISMGIQASQKRDNHLKTPGTLRPWIQDFTARWVKGYISYGPNEVRAQIQALEDNGVDEFLLWNATNRYTEEALKPEGQ